MGWRAFPAASLAAISRRCMGWNEPAWAPGGPPPELEVPMGALTKPPPELKPLLPLELPLCWPAKVLGRSFSSSFLSAPKSTGRSFPLGRFRPPILSAVPGAERGFFSSGEENFLIRDSSFFWMSRPFLYSTDLSAPE